MISYKKYLTSEYTDMYNYNNQLRLLRASTTYSVALFREVSFGKI